MKPFESPPPMHESQSFEDFVTYNSLGKLQAEAAARQRPIRFLAGLEMEIQLDEHQGGAAALDHPTYHRITHIGPANELERMVCRDNGLLYPTPNMLADRWSDTETRKWRIQERRKARAMIGSLRPQNNVQAERQEKWLDEAETMHTIDLINFATYAAFSKPTLGDTAPPAGASYQAQREHTNQSGWLEFRFGSSHLQAGYYDNPGISELRLQPCPPDTLVQREAEIITYMLRLSTHLGIVAMYRTAHQNLSVYEEDLQTGEALPIIGPSQERQAATLDILTGLSAAITQGAAINETLAEKPNIYGTKITLSGWKISPFRSAIRVKDDYIELREQWLQGSTSQAMSWLMAGVLEGLEQGRKALTAQGYAPAEVRTFLRPERTEFFDKDRHIGILRTLEQATIDEMTGTVVLQEQQHANVQQIVREFTGREFESADAARLVHTVLAQHIVMDETGQLSVATEDIELYIASQTPEWRAQFDREVSVFGLEDMIAHFARHIDESGIRIRRQAGIYADPQMDQRTPDDWRKVWQNSPILQRIYGEHLGVYTDILYKKATAHYLGSDYDPLAPDALDRLNQHYVKLASLKRNEGSAS